MIKSLHLRGAIGIKKKSRLDEIKIDFTGREGLIGFSGENGLGKSTVLERLQVFPRFFSRKTNSLKDNFFLKDSFSDLVMDLGANEWRFLLKINGESSTKAPEGFIWKNGESQTNGKISAYERYLKENFWSEDMQLNSFFSAQNETKISDQRTGVIQSLFAEFLNLALWEQRAEISKQCGNVLAGKLAGLDNRIGGLKERIQGAEALNEEINKIEYFMGALTGEKIRHESSLKDLQSQSEKLKEIIASNSATIARASDLRASIERMTKDLGIEKTAYESGQAALRTKYRELKIELGKAEEILKRREEIILAAAEEKRVQGFLERMAIETTALAPEVERIRERIHETEKGIQSLQQKMIEVENNKELLELETKIRDLTHQIAQAEDKIKDLDLKDPTCQSTTCRFITGALGAKDKLPLLQNGLKFQESNRESLILEIEGERVVINKEIEIKNREIKTDKLILLERSGALQIVKESVDKFTADLKRLHDLVVMAPEIQIAEARKIDLEKTIGEIVDDGKAEKLSWETKEISMSLQIREANEKFDLIEAGIDQKAQGKLDVLEGDILMIGQDIIATEVKITEKREALARIKGEIARIEEAEKELQAVQTEREQLIKRISNWKYLQNFCGPKGYQAVELSAALPSINYYSNSLLTTAFGPGCTLNFDSQSASGKEEPRILIYDDDGEEVVLGNRSGGEQVWALKAIKLAMALLSKDRSGWEFDHFLVDEEDGPLSVENAKKFVQLYRACLEIGKFKTGIFISHKPETLNYADHVLRFEAGKGPEWS